MCKLAPNYKRLDHIGLGNYIFYLNTFILVSITIQATEELTIALKSPQTYITLCTLVNDSKDDKLKEYAAVILRKKLIKRNAWMNVSQEVRQQYDYFIIKYIIIKLFCYLPSMNFKVK